MGGDLSTRLSKYTLVARIAIFIYSMIHTAGGQISSSKDKKTGVYDKKAVHRESKCNKIYKFKKIE